MAKKYVTRKYGVQDDFTWAVFEQKHLPIGHKGIVFWTLARPVLRGCTRQEAIQHRDKINAQQACKQCQLIVGTCPTH